MRRFGGPRREGVRYRMRPGAYGVILAGRRALLALTESKGEEIALPGGGIEAGESPLRALHREAMEETGWRVSPIRRIGVYRRFTWLPQYGYQAEKVCHIYLCAAGRQVAAPSEPDHQPIWVDVALAAEVLSGAGDRALFLAALRRAGIST
ncbi:NUDIX domain-containing protein [Pikeienuella piscinae]|nr:NUDIX domain-containing protein [Pikeienuella piscinae]